MKNFPFFLKEKEFRNFELVDGQRFLSFYKEKKVPVVAA